MRTPTTIFALPRHRRTYAHAMVTKRDVEAMLQRLGRASVPHPRDPHAFLVAGSEPHLEPITLCVEDPLATLRLRVGASAGAEAPLLRRLLILNAQALVTSSFGIRGDDLVLEASLNLDRLEEGELGSALAEMDLMRDEALA